MVGLALMQLVSPEGREEGGAEVHLLCGVSAENWSLSSAFSLLKRALGLQKVSTVLQSEVASCGY